jgi:hypothetical protein
MNRVRTLVLAGWRRHYLRMHRDEETMATKKSPKPLSWHTLQNSLVKTLQRRGWPLTKANYLHLMYGPCETPRFPLPAELPYGIPGDLAGRIPRSRTEYWHLLGMGKPRRR